MSSKKLRFLKCPNCDKKFHKTAALTSHVHAKHNPTNASWVECRDHIHKLIGKPPKVRKAKEKLEKCRYFLYFIAGKNAVKIGISKDPQKRLAALQTANHSKLRLVKAFHVASNLANAVQSEKIAHYMFGRMRLQGEWFTLEALSISPFSAASD